MNTHYDQTSSESENVYKSNENKSKSLSSVTLHTIFIIQVSIHIVSESREGGLSVMDVQSGSRCSSTILCLLQDKLYNAVLHSVPQCKLCSLKPILFQCRIPWVQCDVSHTTLPWENLMPVNILSIYCNCSPVSGSFCQLGWPAKLTETARNRWTVIGAAVGSLHQLVNLQ